MFVSDVVHAGFLNGTPTMRLKADGFLDYSHMELDGLDGLQPFPFEVVDWKGWLTFIHKNWQLPIYTSAIYILVIFGIQHLMRNRKAFDLRPQLFLWNAGLGIFSIIGFIRMFPGFYNVLSQQGGFFKSVCVWTGGNMPTAFWGLAFIFSKYVELGDTVFIALRKRPLQFLQWYHHIVTLIACWVTCPYVEPISRYYTIMNYAVHSLMYPYFALRALDVKVPRKLANMITTLQLTQMIIGLAINTYSAILFQYGGLSSCYRHGNSVRFFFLVYGSFALLFGELFLNLVVKSGKKSKKIQ